MSDLARTHWVGDGCVPPHSTEPAVLPPISDSTVTPVVSEGTMRLRRERDEARAEVERLREEATDREATLAGWIEADRAHKIEVVRLREDVGRLEDALQAANSVVTQQITVAQQIRDLCEAWRNGPILARQVLAALDGES